MWEQRSLICVATGRSVLPPLPALPPPIPRRRRCRLGLAVGLPVLQARLDCFGLAHGLPVSMTNRVCRGLGLDLTFSVNVSLNRGFRQPPRPGRDRPEPRLPLPP
jgi:hypothetical protein